VRAALAQRRVAFVPLLAYRDGLANLVDEVGDALVVEAIEELDGADQAFAPEAEIFDSEDDRGGRFAAGSTLSSRRVRWREF